MVNPGQIELCLNYLFDIFKVIHKWDRHGNQFLYTPISQCLLLLWRKFFKTESTCLESRQKSLSSASAVPLKSEKLLLTEHIPILWAKPLTACLPPSSPTSDMPEPILYLSFLTHRVLKQCYWVFYLKRNLTDPTPPLPPK